MVIKTTRIGHELLAFLPMDTPNVPDDEQDIPFTWVMVFVEREGKYLWHFNPNRNQWEMAAGGIKPDEHPDDTARRELWEETSQVATSVKCYSIFKIRLALDKRVEWGALYTAEIEDDKPFVANNETSKLLWWDMKDENAIDGNIGDISVLLQKGHLFPARS